jgi:hypothetical protein
LHDTIDAACPCLSPFGTEKEDCHFNLNGFVKFNVDNMSKLRETQSIRVSLCFNSFEWKDLV